jgi:G patch domain-containing protein 1
MDDEDLQDIKDNLNLVDTTEEMDFTGGTKKELQGKDDLDESDKEYVQISKYIS